MEMQQRSTSQNKFMPKASDPQLYLVRCSVGKESNAVFELYQQMRLSRDTDAPYEIYSVFTNPSSRGFVYIEARKRTEVQRICSAATGLSGWKAVKVALNEMIPALKIPDAALTQTGVGGGTTLLKAGTFVRVKSGVYKNDLALVFRTIDGGSSAVVKIIPRIDYITMATVGGRRGRGTTANRPSQALFDESQARSAGVDFQRVLGRDALGFSTFTQVRSQHFLDGILYSAMPARSLVSNLSSMPPTVREIDLFRPVSSQQETLERTTTADRVAKEGEQRLADAIQDAEKYRSSGLPGEEENTTSDGTASLSGRDALAAAAAAKSRGFVRGDKVVVIAGEMKTLEGEVLSVAGEQVLIRPTNVDGLPPQPFHKSELGKRFRISERVMVLQGMLRGTTGIVININDGLQVLEVISDISQEHAEVPFEAAVHHASVVGSDSTSGANAVRLHDLVSAQGRMGCVVLISLGRAKVLDSDGTVRTVALTEIEPRGGRRSRAAATDAIGHTLQAEDSVIPLSLAELQQVSRTPILAIGQAEMYAGKVCTIKHIIHSKLFVHNPTVREHGGMFVIDASRVKKLTDLAPGEQMATPTGVGAQGAGRIGYNARFDPIRGRYIRITRGSHKGLTARVHSVQGTNDLLVELTAKAKRMQISRADVELINAPTSTLSSASGAGAGAFGGALGSRTPMLGNKTPLLGGATPGYGGQTGAYQGGKTPSLHMFDDDVMGNPWAAKTPMISSTSPTYAGMNDGREFGNLSTAASLPFWITSGAVVRESASGRTLLIVDISSASSDSTVSVLPVIVGASGEISRAGGDILSMRSSELEPVIPTTASSSVITSSQTVGVFVSVDRSNILVQIGHNIDLFHANDLCLYVDPTSV